MRNNIQFTHTTGTPAGTEFLSFNPYTFISNTNVTIPVQNSGSTTVTFQSYTVSDSSGNYWENQGWTLTLTPGITVTLNIAIGNGVGGCGTACTYTGTPGAFNTFSTSGPIVGYTVKLVTSRNNVFFDAI